MLSPHRVCVLNNPILSVALCLNDHYGIMVYDNVRFSIKSFLAFLPWFDRYCRLNKYNDNYAKDGCWKPKSFCDVIYRMPSDIIESAFHFVFSNLKPILYRYFIVNKDELNHDSGR